MSINVLYRTTAIATGGRDGRARSEDGRVDVQLSTPKELGGTGGLGTNPEQLFAAGYSACFIGALKVAGQQLKTKVPSDTSIKATVGIGPRSEGGGFGITADLEISLPGVGREDAQRLVEAAHQICPYSNATRNNIDVQLTIKTTIHPIITSNVSTFNVGAAHVENI
jgi:lipoyl-dependent peroxiredoxin